MLIDEETSSSSSRLGYDLSLFGDGNGRSRFAEKVQRLLIDGETFACNRLDRVGRRVVMQGLKCDCNIYAIIRLLYMYLECSQ